MSKNLTDSYGKSHKDFHLRMGQTFLALNISKSQLSDYDYMKDEIFFKKSLLKFDRKKILIKLRLVY